MVSPDGFHHVITYFYVVSLSALLAHRERRDHARCAEKYGKDWEAYSEGRPVAPGYGSRRILH